MINPQLLNYVRAQRQAGVPREEIIKALAGGGWSATDAQDAFAAIEGVQVPPVAPKPVPPPMTTPAPTPAPQPRPIQPIVQPMAQPVAQPVQMSTRIQPQPVVQRQPVYAQVKKRSVGPWIFMLFLFLIIGFAAGAYTAVAVPVVHDIAVELKNMISPPTLEPVVVEEKPENTSPLPSFMPTFPPLGSNATTTSGTTTASTTTR